MKPINVPIVVALGIKSFSARILLKVKPFWETNRIWFGFYRDPEIKLELEVEPVISNHLIKIQMVNQVIESRIKNVIEQYLMLPHMDDIEFWNFADLSGNPFSAYHPPESTLCAVTPDSDQENGKDGPDLLNSIIMGEPVETKMVPETKLNQSITSYISEVEKHLAEFSPEVEEMVPESPVDTTESTSLNSTQNEFSSELSTDNASYVNYLGDAAYSLGQFSRRVGLPHKVKSIASLVSRSSVFNAAADIVQQQATAVGLTAIEKLGLKPEDIDTQDVGSQALNRKPSKGWSLLGLSISTSAPLTPPHTVSLPSSIEEDEYLSPLESGSYTSTEIGDTDSMIDDNNLRYRTIYKRDDSITPKNSPKI
jgi:hypothetical protein